ncbi:MULTISPECIES: hypothetical protein [unclassified Microcoleus]|uniref:hypothetical protein n=1 Tax=unclassified Microcoleus TaxID=2642155 RepID=UPI0025CF63E9|nr:MULTISPECIES: hypothetical protein [unclassified Microcoleus]
MKYESSGKKPGFWDLDALNSLVGWRETGFLRQFSVKYESSGKKPGFWDLGSLILWLGGEKPGFCDNF